MPRSGELPPAIAGRANRHAHEISDVRFHEDVDHLITILNGLDPGGRRAASSSLRRWGYLVAVVTLFCVAGVMVANRVRVASPALRSQGSVVSGEAAKAMVAKHAFFHARWNEAGSGLANEYATEVLGDAVVVRDGASRLMWQKGGSGDQMEFKRAERFVADLNAEGYAGFSDWRVPTLPEAMTLVDPEADANWYIDPVFERRAAPILWTSDRLDAERHWVVYLGDGACAAESWY